MRADRRGAGRYRRAVVAVVSFALTTAACRASGPGLRGPDVPYVTTPQAVGDEMLTLAAVTASDTVYDLGSGDGRLVIAAARDFGARGVGVEIDPKLIQQSRENAQRAGVAARTEFVWEDLFKVSVAPASVVTLYLLQELNLKLRPRLLAELAPGARVVSHNFHMGEWAPDRTRRVRAPDGFHSVYLWVIPADAGGAWTLTSGERAWTLTLRQRYQDLEGELVTGDGRRPVTGRVAGRDVELTADAPGPATLRLHGRLDGDTARGTIEAGVPEAPAPWSARRGG
ncbi:MAG: class I SAM-dependent methyltransferase [Candidatus Rokubacteria bacterium]|nr:class I SAM-dependent methyltransferase [Candidatus Rokubacteria bacterium]MBI3825335.1 class I SAM-dependent methyltransferase [Candidatus Rokubacteria bacterium]